MPKRGNIVGHISVGVNAILLCACSVFAVETWAEDLPAIVAASQPASAPSLAEENLPAQPMQEEDQSMLEEVTQQRDYLSQEIVRIGKGIDEFFGDKRYFQEHNKSVIQLGLNELMDTGGNHRFLGEIQAKLDFPATQRRFQLVIESNPEQKSANETTQDVAPQNKTTPKPAQYAASLRLETKEESRLHYSSELGAQFQFPLDPFARSRVSYSIPFEDWHLKLGETVFWFSTLGLGETTQIDLEHQLSPPVLFRATNTATCFEAPQNCNLRQDLSIYHTLSDRAAIQYQISVLGVSQPKLAETNYILQTRYRYRWYKDWVFFELNPQISFPKTDAFKMNSFLLLRLEMLFGATR